jgi:hypothetical protein
MKNLVLIISLLLSLGAFSDSYKEKKQSNLNFRVNLDQLNLNDLKYSMKIISTDDLNKTNSIFKNLDLRNLRGQSGIRIVLTKSAFLVDKKESFFTKNRILSVPFNEDTMIKARVYRLSSDKFSVLVDDIFNFSYTMNIKYYSSREDNIYNAKERKLFNNILKFDEYSNTGVLAYRECFDFDGLSKGTAFATRHIQRADGKTVLISYGIMGVKKIYAISGLIESNLKKTVRGFKNAFGNM